MIFNSLYRLSRLSDAGLVPLKKKAEISPVGDGKPRIPGDFAICSNIDKYLDVTRAEIYCIRFWGATNKESVFIQYLGIKTTKKLPVMLV